MRIFVISDFKRGIALLVEDFDLSACGTEKDKKSAFCDFLNTRFGDTMAASLLGRMLPEKIRIVSYLTGIKVEIGYRVFLKQITMRIEAGKNGDNIVMKGDLHFKDKDLRFSSSKRAFYLLIHSYLARVRTRLVSFQRAFSSSRVCEAATQSESADIRIGLF